MDLRSTYTCSQLAVAKSVPRWRRNVMELDRVPPIPKPPIDFIYITPRTSMLSLPRRKVLGAAAAIWGISYSDQIKLYLEERTTADRGSEVGENQAYPRSTAMSHLSGAGTSHHTAPHSTQLEVGIYPKQAKPISVEIDTSVISAGVAMDAEEVEQVAAALVDAIDEVKHWRKEHDYILPLEGFEREDY